MLSKFLSFTQPEAKPTSTLSFSQGFLLGSIYASLFWQTRTGAVETPLDHQIHQKPVETIRNGSEILEKEEKDDEMSHHKKKNKKQRKRNKGNKFQESDWIKKTSEEAEALAYIYVPLKLFSLISAYLVCKWQTSLTVSKTLKAGRVKSLEVVLSTREKSQISIKLMVSIPKNYPNVKCEIKFDPVYEKRSEMSNNQIRKNNEMVTKLMKGLIQEYSENEDLLGDSHLIWIFERTINLLDSEMALKTLEIEEEETNTQLQRSSKQKSAKLPDSERSRAQFRELAAHEAITNSFSENESHQAELKEMKSQIEEEDESMQNQRGETLSKKEKDAFGKREKNKKSNNSKVSSAEKNSRGDKLHHEINKNMATPFKIKKHFEEEEQFVPRRRKYTGDDWSSSIQSSNTPSLFRDDSQIEAKAEVDQQFENQRKILFSYNRGPELFENQPQHFQLEKDHPHHHKGKHVSFSTGEKKNETTAHQKPLPKEIEEKEKEINETDSEDYSHNLLQEKPNQQKNIHKTSRYLEDFKEKKRLGQGGFGTVFLALNKLDKNSYAIKKLVVDKNKKDQFKSVRKEVRVLSKLQHENIVRYYNVIPPHFPFLIDSVSFEVELVGGLA